MLYPELNLLSRGEDKMVEIVQNKFEWFRASLIGLYNLSYDGGVEWLVLNFFKERKKFFQLLLHFLQTSLTFFNLYQEYLKASPNF